MTLQRCLTSFSPSVSSMPKSLSKNVGTSKEPDLWAGWSSFCHWGKGCVITAELWAAAEHVSWRNAKVDLSHLPPYVMLVGRNTTTPILHHNYSHSKMSVHTQRDTHAKNSSLYGKTIHYWSLKYHVRASSKWKISGFLSSSSCVGDYTPTNLC